MFSWQMQVFECKDEWFASPFVNNKSDSAGFKFDWNMLLFLPSHEGGMQKEILALSGKFHFFANLKKI